MSKSSEKSFGQRLAKARQLLEVLKSIPDYNASNAMLSVEAFNTLMAETESINQLTTQARVSLSLKREQRNELYYGLDGLFSISKRIRDYVGSLPSGKDSAQHRNIVAECQKMMSSKTASRKNVSLLKEGEAPPKRISSSEKSFGSILQSVKNILVQINMIDSYEPCPDFVSRQKLQDTIAQVETVNMEVHQELLKVNDVVASRQLKYNGTGGLQDCFQKIKLHLAAAFGKDSNVYLEVSRIKV